MNRTETQTQWSEGVTGVDARESPLRVVVIDMQPITPAVGGGRQRLLGLYHGMGPDIEAIYVGTYDWGGESRRDEQITPTLREICVPLSPEHHKAAAQLSQSLGGATVIDSAYAQQVRLSPGWLDEARRQIAGADVVVFSHPWCYPPLADAITSSQWVVYDAHNVEGVLKTELLGMEGQAEQLSRQVVRAEYDLCRRANMVLACSFEDAGGFNRIYDVPARKIRLVPNGAFTERFAGFEADLGIRARFGLAADKPLGIFLGSSYGPNSDAARFIAYTLADSLPDVQFVIVGSVSEALTSLLPGNVVATGILDDRDRDSLLVASDFAVNPMSAGSGTNIKMFDFLAAGLPVVTTAIGARGICDAHSAPDFIRIVDLEGFRSSIQGLLVALRRHGFSPDAKSFAHKRFSFEAISAELGHLLTDLNASRLRPATNAKSAWLFGTWNVICGISEHSFYFAEALKRQGVDLLVLGNSLEGHGAIDIQRDMHFAVTRPWSWDNRNWRDSGLDMDSIGSLLAEDSPDFALIQHHTGFLSNYHYEQLVKLLVEHRVPTFVEFHDARRAGADFVRAIASHGAHVLVHDEGELDLAGLLKDKVSLMPHPVRLSEDDGSRLATGGPRVIGGFGFLRPYKGVLDSIRVVAELQDRFPGLEYHGWHAAHADSDGAGYLQECLAEAARLGISDKVKINTAFLSVDEVVRALRSVDLVLLPYAPSQEGASGAANLALAAGRPVVTSNSTIFKSLGDVVHRVQDGTTHAYSKEVARMLDDPARLSALAQRSQEWAQANSYDAAAVRLVGLSS